jgi:prepilin-type N-terminal cleavage/methylation domain-containing protein
MKKINLKRGFTLLELLIVVGLIGILAAIVIVALNDARDKGGDAGIQSNLFNAIGQGEIYYNVNTNNNLSYEGVCQVGAGVNAGVGNMIKEASKNAGKSGVYQINQTGVPTEATCRDSENAWAAEVPLNEGGMWCVDSAGFSRKTTTSFGDGYSCPTN